MQLIIDRFENAFAVCECPDGSHVSILRSFLPAEVREGSVLAWAHDAWTLNLQAEQERRAKLFEKQEGLFGVSCKINCPK